MDAALTVAPPPPKQAEPAPTPVVAVPVLELEKAPRTSFAFLLFGILILLALGIGAFIAFQIHTSGVHPSAAGMREIVILCFVQVGVILLVLLGFGLIARSVSSRLKGNSETINYQAQDVQKLRAELDNSSATFKKTKGDLDYANNQLSHTVFQLQNANMQFDIITSELDSAKRETDAIFATVRQGLFLLGPDGAISAQASEEVKSIFQAKDLAHRNLVQLLRPLIPEKRHQTIADYFEILFDARKNEKQLAKFNPLKRVELNFPRPEGGFLPKYVEFSFQRIVNNNAVKNVMVTAIDVTERVKLEERIREGEVLRERQLETLFDILQVDGVQLRTFIDEAKTSIDRINGIFMEPGTVAGSAQLQDKVQRVFRIAHSLKSQAAAHGIHFFERTVHQIEDQLNELRRNPNLANEDLLNVLVSITNFQSQLKETSVLIEKVAGLRRTFNPAAVAETVGTETPIEQPSQELIKSSNELVRTVASRCSKQARVEWKLGKVYDDLPSSHRRILQNAIYQLVRNSVVHGIETPDVRNSLGKDPCGCIMVTLSPVVGKKQVLLLCRDDGAGLDADGIRKRAVNEKLIDEHAVLTENDLYALIFSPGFSTTESANEDAGRGVGLDILRDEVVDKLNGEIQIGFATGRFCEFGLIIPTA